MRWMLALVVVVGCSNDDDYYPETCDYLKQLSFSTFGGLTLATGGVESVTMKCILSDLPGSAPWDIPSTARVTGGDAVSAHAGGGTLVIQALHAGTATVSIVDDSHTYGSIAVTVADFDHVTLTPSSTVVPANASLVFATEDDPQVGVVLSSSDGKALSDAHMQLTLPPEVQHYEGISNILEISSTPVGDYTITATTGETVHSAQLSIVDHADAISLGTAPMLGMVCFDAKNAGRYVASLAWTFTIDGAATTGSVQAPNCVALARAQDTNADGMLTIVASAGGVSMHVDVPTP